MSRYTQWFVSPYPPQQVNNIFTTYLTQEGFEPRNENGGTVWKKGMGILTGPQFIKLTTMQDGRYLLEAWMKMALLPGVYVGEMGTEGFVGCIPKSFLKNRVNALLSQFNAQMINQQQMYANPNVQQMPPQGYANPNAQQMPQQGYVNPNVQQMPPQGYANPNAQQAPQQGYANPNAQQMPPQGYINPNAQRVPQQGYVNPNVQQMPPQGYANPNAQQVPPQGYINPNA